MRMRIGEQSGPAEHALADDRAAEVQERLVIGGLALVADPEPAEVVKPREGSLDDPSLASEP
jgi:hypothetical protein